MDEQHDLERFLTAQDAGGTYDRAVSELRAGRKQSHWMWFVFPQIDGLGRSQTARYFALAGVDEAGFDISDAEKDAERDETRRAEATDVRPDSGRHERPHGHEHGDGSRTQAPRTGEQVPRQEGLDGPRTGEQVPRQPGLDGPRTSEQFPRQPG